MAAIDGKRLGGDRLCTGDLSRCWAARYGTKKGQDINLLFYHATIYHPLVHNFILLGITPSYRN
ncbi:hypothetical protein PRIPAC_90251 [Pristionchus pacificus]|uniref:Uncharacterized protein n=1 Tax=Pristionchus pacificus TaxID=54126 RepID=A0A2A6B3M8_PRIPA|nr:hypothetical protein PRIPAC_90251 [Pristionchus pacificus]|eukprot:PDM60479.1 hypothetical protein PRIPAC_53457 [Pristionchus pacificus]